MNLIEAIKSGQKGKRFKEVDSSQWLVIAENTGAVIYYGGGAAINFTTKQLLADYEVEEEKIELTAEQITAAFMKAMSQIGQPTKVVLLKELGFK